MGVLTTAIRLGDKTNPVDPTTFISGYSLADGTSFSAPIVSGVAALIWSQNKNLTRDQVIARLRGTADFIDDVPGNTRFAESLGSGRVNAARALDTTFQIPAPQISQVELRSSQNTNQFDGVRVYFTQTLDPVAASRPQNYELRYAGNDKVLDTGDDATYTVSVGRKYFDQPFIVGYRAGSNYVDLVVPSVVGTASPVGNYRLRVITTGPNGLKSPYAHAVSGDLTRVFEITAGVGRTGDIIGVDLKAMFGGTLFSNLTFTSATQHPEEDGDLRLEAPGVGVIGRVVLSSRATLQPFASTGRFYFAPKRLPI